VNINNNRRLKPLHCGRKEILIIAKNRRGILQKCNILKGNNMRRTFYRCKRTKRSLKKITTTEIIMLNNEKTYIARMMEGSGS